MKLTPWFDVSQRPRRQGPYERNHNDALAPCFQNWNGMFWGAASLDPDSAVEHSDYQSNFQCGQWRGLAEEPK